MQDELTRILAELDLFLPGMSYDETAKAIIDKLSVAGLQIIE